MFLSISLGTPLLELMPPVALLSESFTRLDGKPMTAFPPYLDPEQSHVTGISPTSNGLMVEFTCMPRSGSERVKLFAKFSGAQTAIVSARVGTW